MLVGVFGPLRARPGVAARTGGGDDAPPAFSLGHLSVSPTSICGDVSLGRGWAAANVEVVIADGDVDGGGLGPVHPTHRADPTVERARARVVERLRARRLETDAAIFARVRDLAPGAAGLEDPEYMAGLRAAVAAALEYVLEGIERGETDGSPPTPPIPAATLEQARRAARTGVSLDTVLRRYLAGLAILEGFVVEEAEQENRIIPPTHVLRDVLANMSALVDRLITAVSRAYGEEIERAGHAPSPAPRALPSPGRAAAPQRDRILEAMVQLAAEHGFAGVSVKLLTARAGVSTRTFYEEFEDLRQCFLAVLDLALERAGGLIVQAFTRERRWQDGVLGALASLLQYFDSEPALTRVWFVQALAAGPWALGRREQIAGMLRSMIVEHWAVGGVQPPDPVATTGVMASVLGLIHTHLVTEQPEPLIELLGPLMGLVTSLYLDKEDVAREVQRGARLARAIQAGEDHRWSPPARRSEPNPAPGVVIPATLANPSARRARECLIFLAEQGGRGLNPSNREIAAAIGVSDQSQISRLLSQLAEEELASKRSEGAGKRNAWRLTPRGEEVARALQQHRN
jgi:AcrR family transcriptional regulator